MAEISDMLCLECGEDDLYFFIGEPVIRCMKCQSKLPHWLYHKERPQTEVKNEVQTKVINEEKQQKISIKCKTNQKKQ